MLFAIFPALYEKLKLLRFPPGQFATESLKKDLLDPKLCRSVNTHELVETSNKRRNCKFNKDYVKKYPWLMIGDDGAFCIHCKLFCSESEKPRIAGGLTGRPWKLYSRMASLDEHSNLSYHKSASTAAGCFWNVVVGKQADIRISVTGKSKEYKDSKAMLESICLTLAVAARQNLALRGHRHEMLNQSSLELTKLVRGEVMLTKQVNQGNFLSLIKLRHDAGDPKLTTLASKPATFTSGSSQNELLDIMATQVRQKIVKDVGSTPFTVISDETTDISTTEQLCLAIRYVDGEEEPKITERFIRFRKMNAVTGNDPGYS